MLIKYVLCLTPWQNWSVWFAKLNCSVLTVLILLWVLLNFRIAYSPPSRWHEETFTRGLGLWCRTKLCCWDELHWCSTRRWRSWLGPQPRHNDGCSLVAWGCSRPNAAFTTFVGWRSTTTSELFPSRIRRRCPMQARSSSLITLLLWFHHDVDLRSHFDVLNLWLWSITCERELGNLVWLVNLWNLCIKCGWCLVD
jgi:hypothetical protein